MPNKVFKCLANITDAVQQRAVSQPHGSYQIISATWQLPNHLKHHRCSTATSCFSAMWQLPNHLKHHRCSTATSGFSAMWQLPNHLSHVAATKSSEPCGSYQIISATWQLPNHLKHQSHLNDLYGSLLI